MDITSSSEEEEQISSDDSIQYEIDEQVLYEENILNKYQTSELKNNEILCKHSTSANKRFKDVYDSNSYEGSSESEVFASAKKKLQKQDDSLLMDSYMS